MGKNDFKILNNYSNDLPQIANKSLWRKGKEEYKKFGEYNFKRSTFWKTTLAGMLYTVICVLPLILILVALYNAFYYKLMFRIFLFVVAWGLLLFCNGLSNYFTVQMSKTYITDDEKLQAFDASAIMFYNCFNIGYMVCTLLIIIFIIMVTL